MRKSMNGLDVTAEEAFIWTTSIPVSMLAEEEWLPRAGQNP